MRKIIAVFLSLLLLAGCSHPVEDSGKIKIITTLFPQYDFVREIGGDKVEVSLLLPPGVESHSFEPSPADIIRINKADLFIYTSQYMEPWAEKLIHGDEMKCGVYVAASGINHEKHGSDIDPHIWTNPQNALKMAENVKMALCTYDSENAGFYTENFEEYAEKLKKLDSDMEKAFSDIENKKLIFGTKFAFHYFAERYGFSHMAAFDSCGHEDEPSAKVMADIIDNVKKENVGAVFHGEMENTKVCETIAAETGADDLMLHSCHNVSLEEFENGESYISLMMKNMENIEKGLKK